MLEIKLEAETNAMLLDSWIVQVVQTANVVDTNTLEDIVKAHAELHVGRVAHRMHDALAMKGRHVEEIMVARIQVWIILVGQVPIEHLETDDLTEF